MTASRTILAEKIREILLERILRGELRPGERLVEMRIAREMGSSQAPVREALGALASLGYVEHEPYRGTRVRQMTEEDLAEIFPVRMVLEELAVREATINLAGATDGLEGEFAALVLAAEREDLRAFALHDGNFHRLIVEAAGNRVLLDTWRTLHVEARVVITVLGIALSLKELAEMHRPILDAITAVSPDDAASEMRRHLQILDSMSTTRGRRQPK